MGLKALCDFTICYNEGFHRCNRVHPSFHGLRTGDQRRTFLVSKCLLRKEVHTYYEPTKRAAMSIEKPPS
eukprot:2646980-Amphidinium_carterae.1